MQTKLSKLSKIQKVRAVISAVAIFTPFLVHGFSLASSTFSDTIMEVLSVIKILVNILSAMSFLAFFWGISKFILNQDNKDNLEKGKKYMIWGIVALFVLISFRSIISLVTNDLDIGDGSIQLLK